MKMTLTTPSITGLHDERSNQIAPYKGVTETGVGSASSRCAPRDFSRPTPVSVSRIWDCTRLPSGGGWLASERRRLVAAALSARLASLRAVVALRTSV